MSTGVRKLFNDKKDNKIVILFCNLYSLKSVGCYIVLIQNNLRYDFFPLGTHFKG